MCGEFWLRVNELIILTQAHISWLPVWEAAVDINVTVPRQNWTAKSPRLWDNAAPVV